MATRSPARLTRAALKKLNAQAGGAAATSPEGHHQILVQEHASFQQGLAPVKRRRVSSSRSLESQESREPDAEEHQPLMTTSSAPAIEVPSVVAEASIPEEPLPLPELAVAREEKALEGAPQGDLFLVTVLSRDELAPSSDVDKERKDIETLIAAMAGDGNTGCKAETDEHSWATEYAALDSLRRFAIHHPKELQALVEPALSAIVCPAATNLRSAMARNALLCIQDVLLCCAQDSTRFLDDIVPLLLQRTVTEKQFLRDLALSVLDTSVTHCAGAEMIRVLLKVGSTEKNAQIVSSAGVTIAKCMQKLDEATVRAIVTAPETTFWSDVAGLLNCKVVECKTATRKTLQLVRKALGDATFSVLAKEKLSGTAQVDVLKASSGAKKRAPARSGLPKLSMRERMLQMKQQQQQRPPGESSADETVVVIAAKPPPPLSSAANAGDADGGPRSR